MNKVIDDLIKGHDFAAIVEGCVEGINSRGAQKRKWADDIKK